MYIIGEKVWVLQTNENSIKVPILLQNFGYECNLQPNVPYNPGLYDTGFRSGKEGTLGCLLH